MRRIKDLLRREVALEQYFIFALFLLFTSLVQLVPIRIALLVVLAYLPLYALALIAGRSRSLTITNCTFLGKAPRDVVEEVEPLWSGRARER